MKNKEWIAGYEAHKTDMILAMREIESQVGEEGVKAFEALIKELKDNHNA